MEPGTAAPSDTSVVRVLGRDGRPEGAGFLVGRRDVVTCAHVVARVLGVAADAAQAPGGRLEVDFPLVAPGRRTAAEVTGWTPIAPDGSGDVAVLRLVEAAPARAASARVVEQGAASDRRVRTFGFPAGHDDGVWSVGWLRGRTAAGWYQYDTDPAGQHRVRPGFSGAPVWDVAEGGVVGMVVAADGAGGGRSAYLIPTETLRAGRPELGPAARPVSPFRALEPFAERHADRFHGREQLTGRIVDQLAWAPVLGVVGPSGCGKSSLVHAGVLPGLRRQDGLHVVTLRPGQHGRSPVEALATALLPALEPALSETARLAELPALTELLRDGRLPELTDRLLARQGKDRLLLMVDQFEEALSGTEATDLDTLAAALAAALRPGSPLRVVTVLRSDFLTAALTHPGLAPLFGGDRLVTVGAMTDSELRAAVQRPLEGTGVRYEPGLVDRILGDLGGDPGRLPLLAFTLAELWDRQQDGAIGHTAYEALGGVGQALARHAEQLWTGSLSEDEQRAARALLVQLVQPGGDGTAPTRRTAARSDLNDRQWRIAQRLLTTRLIVPGAEYLPADGPPEETVELAHEVLLTHWDRLRGWFEADREFRTWQADLRRRIGRWQGDGRPARRLLRGAELRDARTWQRRRADELPPTEREFIAASVRGSHRRWSTAVALTVVLGLLVGLGTWAWQDTVRDEAATTASEVLVQQSRDADGAFVTDRGSSYTALLLAMRAYRTRDTEQTRARLGEMYAKYGFADLLVPRYPSSESPLAGLTGALPAATLTDASGRMVVGWAGDGTAVVLRLGTDGVHRQPTGRRAAVIGVSPDGSALAMGHTPPFTADSDSRGLPVELYDVRTGAVRELERPVEGDPLRWDLDVSGVLPGFELPDLAQAGADGLTLPTQYAQFSFSADGSLLLARTGAFGTAGRVVLWDTASGRIRKVMPAPSDLNGQLWLGAGGDSLLSLNEGLGRDMAIVHSLRLWDLRGDAPTGRELLHWDASATDGLVVGVSPTADRAAVVESRIGAGGTVSHHLVVHELPSGHVLSDTTSDQQVVASGVTIAPGGSHAVPYQTDGAFPIADSRPVATGPDDGPVLSIGGNWTLDLFGTEAEPAVLMADPGLLAVVAGRDPLTRLPKPGQRPDAADAGARLAALCRALGDETLPDAAARKLPPGAYRGQVCSTGKE
ncbi:trypsin-like peptidase domain-containing protein [Kitasatospora sp. NPDC059673]|uniref:nSTAND1 domain-containing NTPase n=1 Tax=Kitasatospora sp. NPDC059673 TaxID=3346901 RepID=UPI0036B502FB